MAVQASSMFSDTNLLGGIPVVVTPTAGGGNWLMAETFPNSTGGGGGGHLDFMMLKNDVGLREWNGTTLHSMHPSSSSSDEINLPHSRFFFFPSSSSDHHHDEMAKQRSEIDFFLQLQTERLKLAIVDTQRNNNHFPIFLNRIDKRLTTALHKKDADLLQAKQRTKELEDWLHRTEMESVAWKNVVYESESIIIGLNTMLQQTLLSTSRHQPEDAESSVCDFSGGERDHNHHREVVNSLTQIFNGGGDGTAAAVKGLGWCKWCGMRRSSLVFMPCKHFCACITCGDVLGKCPVCHALKEYTIQVATM